MKSKTIATFSSDDFEIIFCNINSCKLTPFTTIDIELFYKKKNTILYHNDFIIDGTRSFYSMLQKSINGKLDIEYSLHNQEIGKVWNEYYFNLFMENKSDNDDIVSKYIMWSTSSEILTQTWLYNKANNIILEVTPNYDMEKYGEKKDHFFTFVNNYNSILKAVIPKDVAIKWFNKAEEILTEIDDKLLKK